MSASNISIAHRDCDDNHTHEPWGHTPNGWATSLEVEYPTGLCREWAQCLRLAAVQHGAIDLPNEMLQDTSANLNHLAKESLCVHVRGKRLRSLMREDSYTVRLTGPLESLAALPKIVDKPLVLPATCQSNPPILVLPAHAKLLQTPILQGEKWGRYYMTQLQAIKWNLAYHGSPWSLSSEPVACRTLATFLVCMRSCLICSTRCR